MIVAFRPTARADRVNVMLLDKVSAKEFMQFRNGCARMGAEYLGSEGTFIAKRDSVHVGRATFEALGFKVEVDADLAPVVERKEAQRGAVAQAALSFINASSKEWQLRQYQKEGVAWLAPRDCALLADDPGLGKTLEFLMALGEGWRVLVVCPAIARFNWEDESRLRRPDYRTTVLEGLRSFRWPEPGEIVMTSYEILPGEIEVYPWGEKTRRRVRKGTVPQCPGQVALIGDEIHKLRNNHTQAFMRWCAVRDAIPEGRDKRVWGGTGTELMKGDPMEHWNVLRALKLEKRAFGDLPRFIHAYGGTRRNAKASAGGVVAQESVTYGKFKWPPIAERLANLSPKLIEQIRSVSLKRLQKDALPELPGKTYRWQRVEIDDATRIKCDLTLASLKEQGIDLADVQKTVDLSAIAGVAFKEISRVRAALAVAKIKATIEIVEEYEEQGEPLIVFSAHRAPVLALGKRPGWACITGSTNARARRDIKDKFQAGQLKGVAGVTRAMGEAITLTHGCTLLFVDLEWVPEQNRQAEMRALRFGQKRGVIVIRLVANHPLDRRVLELLAERQAFIEATTERAAVVPGMVQCA